MTLEQRRIYDSGVCPSCHCEITSNKCYACLYFRSGVFLTQVELDEWNSGKWLNKSLNEYSDKSDVHASLEFVKKSVNSFFASACSSHLGCDMINET